MRIRCYRHCSRPPANGMTKVELMQNAAIDSRIAENIPIGVGLSCSLQ